VRFEEAKKAVEALSTWAGPARVPTPAGSGAARRRLWARVPADAGGGAVPVLESFSPINGARLGSVLQGDAGATREAVAAAVGAAARMGRGPGAPAR